MQNYLIELNLRRIFYTFYWITVAIRYISAVHSEKSPISSHLLFLDYAISDFLMHNSIVKRGRRLCTTLKVFLGCVFVE